MQWYSISNASDEVLEAVAEEFVTSSMATAWDAATRKSSKLPIYPPASWHEAGDGVEELLSDHAEVRLRQRGLGVDDVDYILCHGVCEQVAAATIYFLRAADLAGDEAAFRERLVGTALIAAPDRDYIITVWRNRKHGRRNLRQKRQRRWRMPSLVAAVAA